MDAGRDLLGAIEVTKDGKAVKGEPSGGAHQIKMKKGMTFHGHAEAALKELEKSFPGCKFEWAKDA